MRYFGGLPQTQWTGWTSRRLLHGCRDMSSPAGTGVSRTPIWGLDAPQTPTARGTPGLTRTADTRFRRTASSVLSVLISPVCPVLCAS